MRTPTRRGKTKESFWRKVLTRLAASGLTQVEFCKRENLNANNLSWWKREIAIRDADGTNDRPQQEISKENYWRKMIARFNSSDLSKDVFCTREGIKPAAFTWWRAEFERRDRKAERSVVRPLKPSPDLFIPLMPVAPVPARPTIKAPQPIAEIEILTGTVRIFNTATGEELIGLLRALKESIDDKHAERNTDISLYRRHGHAQEF